MLSPSPTTCRRCRQLAVPGTSRCQDCHEKHRLHGHKHYQRLKSKVFQAYGGFRCNCCGDTYRDGLQIDHIHNDGAAHRKQLTKTHFYRWIVNNGFPSLFQVLCAVCNMAKALNGHCPCQQYGRKVANPQPG